MTIQRSASPGSIPPPASKRTSPCAVEYEAIGEIDFAPCRIGEFCVAADRAHHHRDIVGSLAAPARQERQCEGDG
jgi:hypothetical protein